MRTQMNSAFNKTEGKISVFPFTFKTSEGVPYQNSTKKDENLIPDLSLPEKKQN